MNTKSVESVLAIISLVLIILAGVLGIRRESQEVNDFLSLIVPQGYRAEPLNGERFALFEADNQTPEFFLINESASSYGGKMLVSVLLDTAGIIRDLQVLKHRETPSFLDLTEKAGFRKSIIGKAYNDPFVPGEDVDVVSGATYTCGAILECAQVGSGKIARDQLSFEVSAPETPGLNIGVPEIALILLYILALIGVYRKSRYQKTIRWITMLGGLLILGFWFALPLTLSNINAFLLGYYPDWHTHLYWYLLLGGFLISIVLTRKNIYCTWICPLGGMQECLGVVGGARPRFSRQFNRIMKWAQRGVALVAILLALYFRNPVKLNYEIFGVALSLTGATYLYIMTGLFVMASLFILRPWCTYLCPIIPVSDMLRLFSPKKRR